MKNILILVLSILATVPEFSVAGIISTRSTAPTTCAVGDVWINPSTDTNDRIYTCTATNTWTKNTLKSLVDGKADASAFASQSAFTSAWGWTPGGGVSAWSDIQALLTGTGTYVKADGTTGDPTGTITTGTGVAAAMANALDGTGGLASKASLDALPNIVFGTGITVAEDTPSAGTDTVSIDADTTPTSGSAKLLTSGGAYTALSGKEPADATIIKVAEIDTQAEFEALVGWAIPTGGGSFAFDTFPTYEDSPHSSGIAVNGTTLAVYSATAGKWLTVGLTDTLDATPVTYAATLTITDTSATGDTFTLNSIAYDSADSPVSVTNLPTATEQITYTGSNTAVCTGDVTGTGPWTINTSPATVGCTITPVVAAFCDGTETFCTSWETGTGVLNTGATGNEDVFSSADGFSKISTSPKDGSYCVQGSTGDVLATTNAGLGFGNAVSVIGYVRIDAESSGESYISIISDSNDYYGVLIFMRATDSNITNSISPVKFMAKLTSSSLEQVGSEFNINVGEWYRYEMVYNTNTNIVTANVYDQSNNSVFSSGNVSATLNFNVETVGIYASGYGNISHDGLKVKSL